MTEESSQRQHGKGERVSIIGAVKTPLGFFVLVVLLVELVLGTTAGLTTGQDRTYLIVGMLILIFSLVLIVAGMAVYRPTSLYGKPMPSPKESLGTSSQDPSDVLAKSKIEDTADLRRFFGDDILTDSFLIVHGTFDLIPAELDAPARPIYQKIYRNKTKFQMMPPDTITTLNTVHALSYFLQEFSRYRERPFTICTDGEAFSAYHNSAFLTISGPLSNEFTEMVLGEAGNRFLRFTIEQREGGPLARIESISDRKTFAREPGDIGADLGVIVKLRNSMAPDRYVFVCAGLERQGTSAATWYLTNRWRELYQEFGTKEFGIVVKVVREQDNLTKCIHSAS